MRWAVGGTSPKEFTKVGNSKRQFRRSLALKRGQRAPYAASGYLMIKGKGHVARRNFQASFLRVRKRADLNVTELCVEGNGNAISQTRASDGVGSPKSKGDLESGESKTRDCTRIC